MRVVDLNHRSLGYEPSELPLLQLAKIGADRETRTPNILITSEALYQLELYQQKNQNHLLVVAGGI